MTDAPMKIVIDLPDEGTDELEVSHLVEIAGIEVRVLAEPHQWHLLRSQTDPQSVLKAFAHPDDFAKLDTFLQGRRKFDGDVFTKILNALVEKPTGHPSIGSPASSDS